MGYAENEIVPRRGPAPSFRAKPLISRASKRMQFYLLLALTDLLAITLGFAIVGGASFVEPVGESAFQILATLLALFFVLATYGGSYGLATLQDWVLGVRRVLTALSLAALSVLALAFALKTSAEYSRLFFVLGLALSFALTVLGRMAVHALQRLVFATGPVEEVMFTDRAEKASRSNLNVIDVDALRLRPKIDCPQTMERIGQLLRHADRVIVDCEKQDRQAWVLALKSIGIEVEVLVPEFEGLGVLAMSRHGSQLTAVVAKRPLGMRERMAKRTFDLVIAFCFLPMLLLVTAVVAVLIKLEDGGPIFFVQKRIGQGNRLFDIYKFRSMRVDCHDAAGDRSASREDNRVTRIGRFLRASSLDELPQLYNVLTGVMSVVGPRPHATGSTAEDELFWVVDHRYWIRHAAKPGLTGLAQVRGFRGATETREDLINRIQADLEYQSGWSIWRDIRILVATLKVVFHDNAF